MSIQTPLNEPIVGNDNDETITGNDDVEMIAEETEEAPETEQSPEPSETEDEEELELSEDEASKKPVEPSEEDIHEGMRLVEAMLFASSEPMSERSISVRIPENLNTKFLLKSLQEDYAPRGVNLRKVGTSWAFRTADDIGGKLNIEAEVSRKIGRAAIETMAIIAYHQPVTRAEIEEIRGVSLSKGTLDFLFEKSWIKPRGRRETPGRPMTWGTSDDFLDHFGLARISDLPGLDELRAAGLLESGPALNVYRSRSESSEDENQAQGELLAKDQEGADQDPNSLASISSHGEEDALPEVEVEIEDTEPLDPDDNN